MHHHPPADPIGHVPAIDGLRAVAVLAVVTYHLWPAALPGGFTGVDIFFTISGFVVTRSLAGHRFAGLKPLLLHFYARRLIRIMPALIAMLLVVALATQMLIPEAWLSGSIPQTGRFAFVGLSNIILATDTDTYFGPQAAYNPFTHTWSLGVEEQFYLLFPFLLHCHQRVGGGRGAIRPIAWLSAGSLALCAVVSFVEPRLAFYLIPTRFWELGVGVLLCLTAPVWLAWLEGSGGTRRGALAVGSMVLVGAGLASPPIASFPFPVALLPVLGTAGLIALACAAPTAPLQRVLASVPAVAIGRRSYSLYLWHWPVYVLFRWTIGLDTLALQLGALSLAVVLAALSYALIEQPFRASARIARLPRARVVQGAVAAVAGATAIGAGLFGATDQLSLSVTRKHVDWYADARYPLNPARTQCGVRMEEARLAGGKVTSWTPEACRSRAKGFALYAVGDSHNLAYAPAYRQLAAELGVPVRAFFRPRCPFVRLREPMDPNGRCRRYYAALFGELAARVRPGDVVYLPGLRLTRLANQFDDDGDLRGPHHDTVDAANLAEAAAAIARIGRLGAHVVIEAPKPIFPSPTFRCSDWFNRMNPSCAGGQTIARARIERMRGPVLRAMRTLAARDSALVVWDPLPILCGAVTCEAAPGGRPNFFDGDHLSGRGNDVLYVGLRDAILTAHAKAASTRDGRHRREASYDF